MPPCRLHALKRQVHLRCISPSLTCHECFFTGPMAEIQRHTGPGCRTLQSSTSVWQSLHWSQYANSRISGGVAPRPGRPDPSHLRTAGAGVAAAAEDPDRESGEIAVDAVPANDVDATSKRPRDGSRGHSTKVSGREHSTRCCLIVNTHILKQFEPCSHSCGFCHCNACSTSRLYRCIVRMQDDRSPWSPSGNVRTDCTACHLQASQTT